jgi:hypothetical protein
MAKAGEIAREPRKRVRVTAEMRVGGDRAAVTICDVSSRGLMLQGRDAPARGAYVEVVRPGATIVARVVWTDGSKFGVQTRDRIDLSSLVSTRASFGKASNDSYGGTLHPAVAPAAPRAAAVHTAQRSFQLSSRMQFAIIVLVAAGFALATALLIHDLLSDLHAVVVDALD